MPWPGLEKNWHSDVNEPTAHNNPNKTGAGTDIPAARSFGLTFTRLAVGIVFAWNVLCAFEFILRPALYASTFELSGATGQAALQGFGVLFLMWNATYPPVIVQPWRQRTLFGVILAQQAIGLLGESWIWLQLPAELTVARSATLRFIVFDGAGLLLLAAAYLALFLRRKKSAGAQEGE